MRISDWSSDVCSSDLLAVETVPPTTVTAARLVLAAALLYPLIRLRGYSLPKTRAAWTGFFAVGLLRNMLPFILITDGLDHLAIGISSSRERVCPPVYNSVVAVSLKNQPINITP